MSLIRSGWGIKRIFITTVAGIFLLWSLSLAGTSIIAGIIALGTGLFLLPEARHWLREEQGLEFDTSKKNLLILTIVSIFLVSALSGSGSSSRELGNDDVQVDQNGGVPVEDYRELESKYRQLQQENQQLRSNFVPEDEYNRLREENKRLQERQRYAVYPPYVVAEDRSYRLTYRTLSDEVVGWEYDAETLSAQVQIGALMREMSVRNLEIIGATSVASKFEGDTKYQQLGDFGRYYQLKPFIVESNFRLLSQDIYSRYDSDPKRVRAVWNFVTQLNVYSTELEETPRMPLETLLMGGGDCEDTAILAASMLKAMPADWEVSLVYMDADRPTDPQEIDHVLVYVDTGEYQTFMETTTDSEMSPYSEVDGFYVEV